MISKVGGCFDKFAGQIVPTGTPLRSCAPVPVHLNSVSTGDQTRDDGAPDGGTRAAFPATSDVSRPGLRACPITPITGLARAKVQIGVEATVVVLRQPQQGDPGQRGTVTGSPRTSQDPAQTAEREARIPAAGAVVCIAVAMLATRLWPTKVLLAAFFVAYQQLENYVLAPRIMRRPVQLSPAAVLLAGLIGGTVLGLIGALMAIPIAAGGKVLLSERLQARDAVDTGDAAPGAGTTARQPGQATPDEPPAGPAQSSDRGRQPAAQGGDRRDDPTPG